MNEEESRNLVAVKDAVTAISTVVRETEASGWRLPKIIWGAILAFLVTLIVLTGPRALVLMHGIMFCCGWVGVGFVLSDICSNGAIRLDRLRQEAHTARSPVRSVPVLFLLMASSALACLLLLRMPIRSDWGAQPGLFGLAIVNVVLWILAVTLLRRNGTARTVVHLGSLPWEVAENLYFPKSWLLPSPSVGGLPGVVILGLLGTIGSTFGLVTPTWATLPPKVTHVATAEDELKTSDSSAGVGVTEIPSPPPALPPAAACPEVALRRELESSGIRSAATRSRIVKARRTSTGCSVVGRWQRGRSEIVEFGHGSAVGVVVDDGKNAVEAIGPSAEFLATREAGGDDGLRSISESRRYAFGRWHVERFADGTCSLLFAPDSEARAVEVDSPRFSSLLAVARTLGAFPGVVHENVDRGPVIYFRTANPQSRLGYTTKEVQLLARLRPASGGRTVVGSACARAERLLLELGSALNTAVEEKTS